jgi:hypothetical protein
MFLPIDRFKLVEAENELTDLYKGAATRQEARASPPTTGLEGSIHAARRIPDYSALP